MALQRIRTGSTGHLTSEERKSFASLVTQYNSDFRVKAGSVADVTLEDLDPGAIVMNTADSKMYFCDDTGWKKAGSPIQLTVTFTSTQFAFKFKAPSTSTLIMNDGDGTMTAVAGQDDVEVTHTTAYSTPGTYSFYVEGDYVDLTWIRISNQSFVSGDVSRFSELVNLTVLYLDATGITGSLNTWGSMTSMDSFYAYNTELGGDISAIKTWTSAYSINVYRSNVYGDVSELSSWAGTTLRVLNLNTTNVSGDVSKLYVCTNVLLVLNFFSTNVTFDGVDYFVNTGTTPFFFQDCGWTSEMVDNALIAFAGGEFIGKTINIGGTNASRTSASDAAFAYLDANNTLTVNSPA